jgi:predicted nucleotidyltransferase
MEISKNDNILKIKELTAPIFKKYGVEKAYVFGSYARGDYNENSDIDIIIASKNIKSLLVIGAILESLKSALNKEVDLIEEECFSNMDEIDEPFYNNILKERVIIYG